jgi:L-ascorbate metabolism protein UlaG (beta-lactamase superfamily)
MQQTERKAGWRWFRRGLALCGLLLVAVLTVLGISAWSGLGKAAAGARLERMQRSPQWHDGHFDNPQPLVNDFGLMIRGMFHASVYRAPDAPMPVQPLAAAAVAQLPASGLRVTWLGHASSLIELDGVRVVTDPMWSERSSPTPLVGPTRWYPPPLALRDLPHIDAVVISHDHFDHLDQQSVIALSQRHVTFIVPLGVGAHLEYWGIPADEIRELDWWERTTVGAIEVVCTPARHASGRALWDKDAKLWAGYALLGPQHRVFFSGDTGLFPAMREIGDKLGPFDLTMIETGQYHQAWPDWHIGPEQAVEAHRMLRGKVFLPIHWALLTLAYHGWTEPIERVVAAAKAQGVTVATPKPGQPFEPTDELPQAHWWPAVPFETAAQSPIRSGGMD